ncbi:hypothetical protein DINM_006511 [Dirofilaria immitis]|nr:hypothetical protein [Dirofilaria immitis]
MNEQYNSLTEKVHSAAAAAAAAAAETAEAAAAEVVVVAVAAAEPPILQDDESLLVMRYVATRDISSSSPVIKVQQGQHSIRRVTTKAGAPNKSRAAIAIMVGIETALKLDDLNCKPQIEYENCPVCGDQCPGTITDCSPANHASQSITKLCFYARLKCLSSEYGRSYQCSADQNCAVDKSCRKRCPHCRFQKCIQRGMKVEAVREDRMRGGRNKFGSYYKRDRAQRMQRIALRTNGTHNFLVKIPRNSNTSTGIAASATATSATAVHAQYFDTSGSQKFKNDYDALLQSPTLSSSTQSPTNYVVPRPSAYLPNCDNLAALLGSSIDDPLLRSSSFPIYSCVKPEPFDGYTEASFSQSSLPADYSPFCPPTSSYTAMTAMTPVAVAATPAAGTTTDRSSPLLPICPLPTEKTIDNVFYAPKQTALLCSCTESLLDPNLLLHLLGKGDKTRDAFQYCKSVIEESLNSIVTWAKNAPYFEQLPVDDQIALIYTSWAPIHVLDFTFHILHSHLPISIQFGNNPLPVSTICLMGFDTLAPKFNDLCNKLQSLNFDRCDYAAFKVLTLFGDRGERSAVNNSALTAQIHLSILTAWAAYRSVPIANDHPLYVVYEELKKQYVASKVLEFLRYSSTILVERAELCRPLTFLISSAVPIIFDTWQLSSSQLLARQAAHLLSKYSTVGMEENLLKEMLTRKEHHLVSQQPSSSIPPSQQQYA